MKLGLLILCAFCAFSCTAFAQTKGDPNKFALIVNGAGGEAVYGKQFEERESLLIHKQSILWCLA